MNHSVFIRTVVKGAAIQAAIITGVKSGDIVLLDVISLPLGIETDGFMSVLVERNTTIPTKKTERFTTVVDNQSTVTIKVFEGDGAMVKDNNLLGKLSLTGISPSPQGVPQIIVTFEIDAGNVLTVTATEKRTERRSCITITDSDAFHQVPIINNNSDEITAVTSSPFYHQRELTN